MGEHVPTNDHIWYTPAECAALLEAKRHGNHWRAACPAHQGENAESLHIAQGQDRYGNPVTLLHCFAHQCPVEDICAAMGIGVKNLFCVQLAYAKHTRGLPRTHSPRLASVKAMVEPPPSTIAQMLLEEMIVSDPEWIQTCEPAREKLWELAQASPKAHQALTACLREARITPVRFWQTLATDMEG